MLIFIYIQQVDMFKFSSYLRQVLLSALFLSLIIMNSCYYDNDEDLYKNLQTVTCDTTNVTYSGSVAPLMQSNCVVCHSSTSAGGGYAFDSYDAVSSVLSDGLNSRFWGSINQLSGYSPMPQGGNKFTECDLKKIEIWIKAGYPNN